ncbi:MULTISPECIES: hypothetical protein [Marinimicrobium]|uniref:hypothetical protein n=1 Tax=Marinimicrobium TaxID=359337 RepID=UPI000467E0DB|nr:MULTISPECIES: hypothetical protein [Marinimicrobium]
MKYIYLFILLAFPFESVFGENSEFEELRAASEAHLSQLDGEWLGEISGLELQGDYPDQPYKSEIIIRIDGDEVLVGAKRGDNWYEMPYDFKIIRHKTHAIVYAFAAKDAWVEAFNFTITLNSVNEMALVWSRVVNNYVLPVDDWESRGYFQGFSLLERQ